MQTLVSLFVQPLISQLVQVRPTLIRAITHKEIALDIPNHTFILAFGSSPIKTTDARCEAVPLCQIYKTLNEV
jgi:hypothetical protein